VKAADVPQAWHLGNDLYKFMAKFGGMDVSDARRLKALEDENARLKKLLAEQMLDNAILKDVAAED
jgi:putative transposase